MSNCLFSALFYMSGQLNWFDYGICLCQSETFIPQRAVTYLVEDGVNINYPGVVLHVPVSSDEEILRIYYILHGGNWRGFISTVGSSFSFFIRTGWKKIWLNRRKMLDIDFTENCSVFTLGYFFNFFFMRLLPFDTSQRMSIANVIFKPKCWCCNMQGVECHFVPNCRN